MKMKFSSFFGEFFFFSWWNAGATKKWPSWSLMSTRPEREVPKTEPDAEAQTINNNFPHIQHTNTSITHIERESVLPRLHVYVKCTTKGAIYN